MFLPLQPLPWILFRQLSGRHIFPPASRAAQLLPSLPLGALGGPDQRPNPLEASGGSGELDCWRRGGQTPRRRLIPSRRVKYFSTCTVQNILFKFLQNMVMYKNVHNIFHSVYISKRDNSHFKYFLFTCHVNIVRGPFHLLKLHPLLEISVAGEEPADGELDPPKGRLELRARPPLARVQARRFSADGKAAWWRHEAWASRVRSPPTPA